MSEELKKCPFCGGEDVLLRFKECVNALGCMNGYYYVECQYCATVSGCSSKENVAIEDWNTRPEEDRLKAENERLKEALKKIDDLTFMPRHKDEALDRAWHITRAALIHANAPDMDDGRKTEINGENLK